MDSDQVQSPDRKERKHLDFPEKVEGVVSETVGFGKSYLLTLFDLGFRQCKFAKAQEGISGRYVRPLTLLFLQTFITIKVFRFIIASVALAIVSFLRSCDGQTYVEIEQPEILTGILSLPSLQEVALVGIPMFIGIMAITKLVAVLLVSTKEKARILDELIYYSIAFQFASYMLVAIIIIVSFSEVGLDLTWEPSSLVGESVVVLAGLAFVAWPSFIFYRLFVNCRLSSKLRFSGRLGKTQLAFCALLLTALSTLSALAISYPYIISDTKDFSRKMPVIGVNLIDDSVQDNSFTVLLTNNSKEDLWVDAKSIQLTHSKHRALQITEGTFETEISVFALRAGDSRPIRFVVQPPDLETEGPAWRSVKEGAVKFDCFGKNGRRHTIYSLIIQPDDSVFVPIASTLPQRG